MCQAPGEFGERGAQQGEQGQMTGRLPTRAGRPQWGVERLQRQTFRRGPWQQWGRCRKDEKEAMAILQVRRQRPELKQVEWRWQQKAGETKDTWEGRIQNACLGEWLKGLSQKPGFWSGETVGGCTAYHHGEHLIIQNWIPINAFSAKSSLPSVVQYDSFHPRIPCVCCVYHRYLVKS